MNKKFNLNHLFAAIALYGAGIFGLYAGLINGFDGFYFIPGCFCVFLGTIYARNVKIK